MLFCCSKNTRLDSTHYFIKKNPNNRDIQQIVVNQSSDIDFKDFVNLYKKSTETPYSFLVIHVPLASDNPSRFNKKRLGTNHDN